MKVVVVFILVPKNTGLKKYREIALSNIKDLEQSKIIEARAEDIPFLLKEFEKKSKKAIGLTGEDLFKEYCLENQDYSLEIVKRINWEDSDALFGKPALCFIGPDNKDIDSVPKDLIVYISSKYKNIAKKYLNFLEKKNFTFKKIYINGCVETSCSEGLSDFIIDVVYTGSSIREKKLKIFDKIMQSDFLIIKNSVEFNLIKSEGEKND